MFDILEIKWLKVPRSNVDLNMTELSVRLLEVL